jgi:hypothetical protein
VSNWNRKSSSTNKWRDWVLNALARQICEPSSRRNISGGLRARCSIRDARRAAAASQRLNGCPVLICPHLGASIVEP